LGLGVFPARQAELGHAEAGGGGGDLSGPLCYQATAGG
jgi:hypothetical protein